MMRKTTALAVALLIGATTAVQAESRMDPQAKAGAVTSEGLPARVDMRLLNEMLSLKEVDKGAPVQEVPHAVKTIYLTRAVIAVSEKIPVKMAPALGKITEAVPSVTADGKQIVLQRVDRSQEDVESFRKGLEALIGDVEVDVTMIERQVVPIETFRVDLSTLRIPNGKRAAFSEAVAARFGKALVDSFVGDHMVSLRLRHTVGESTWTKATAEAAIEEILKSLEESE